MYTTELQWVPLPRFYRQRIPHYHDCKPISVVKPQLSSPLPLDYRGFTARKFPKSLSTSEPLWKKDHPSKHGYIVYIALRRKERTIIIKLMNRPHPAQVHFLQQSLCSVFGFDSCFQKSIQVDAVWLDWKSRRQWMRWWMRPGNEETVEQLPLHHQINRKWKVYRQHQSLCSSTNVLSVPMYLSNQISNQCNVM